MLKNPFEWTEKKNSYNKYNILLWIALAFPEKKRRTRVCCNSLFCLLLVFPRSFVRFFFSIILFYKCYYYYFFIIRWRPASGVVSK